MSTALVGDLSITAADGTVLTDRTDVGLARQWAAHEYGPAEWDAMTWIEQNREVGAALAGLRTAAQN